MYGSCFDIWEAPSPAPVPVAAPVPALQAHTHSHSNGDLTREFYERAAGKHSYDILRGAHRFKHLTKSHKIRKIDKSLTIFGSTQRHFSLQVCQLSLQKANDKNKLPPPIPEIVSRNCVKREIIQRSVSLRLVSRGSRDEWSQYERKISNSTQSRPQMPPNHYLLHES